MPVISKIKLPNDSQTYDLTDGRGMFVGACSSSAASQTKEVSVSVDQNFVLRAGAVVAVKFASTNTYNATTSAPCKLNVNGTGAKNIYYAGSATPTGTSTTVFGTANYYHYYIYDGTYWVWNGYSWETPTDQIPVKNSVNSASSGYVYNISKSLVNQINNGAKNRMPFKIADIKQQNTNGTWSGNTFTHSTGVAFTINSDYSIMVNGTASGANAAFVISPNGKFTIENGEWVLSGTPSGGSTTSYNISIEGTASDVGNSIEFSGCTNKFIRIYVVKGTTVSNLIFKPMICSKEDYALSSAYTEYCPSLQELYKMILVLQG